MTTRPRFVAFARATATGADTLAAMLDDEYESALTKLRALGGLSITRWHAATVGGDASRLVAGIARSAAADSSIWIAPANEVASWWLRRSRLVVSTVAAGDSMTVAVANKGTAPTDDAVVRVVAPTGRSIASVSGATRLASPPDYLALLLPRLAPGSAHVVTIHLNPGSRGSRAR